MAKSKVSRYFLVFLLLLFVFLATITIFPLIKSLILAFVLAYAFYPTYNWFLRKTKSKNLSASIMLLLIIILIILPMAYILHSLVNQAYSTYSYVEKIDFNYISNVTPSFLNGFDVNSLISDVMFNLRNYILSAAPNLIGSIAQTILGLFIMFFVLFYSFKDGKNWVNIIKSHLPLRKEYSERLFQSTRNITGGVIYGYVLTALIQGTLGGLAFLVIGIPNPVFWGFLMFILAAIPFLGTPIVWLPAALILLFKSQYVAGVGLLLYGYLFLINIDNFIRPKLIGGKTKIHSAVILVGIFGGLSVFGFIGILVGPLVLALFVEVLKFSLLEFKS